MIPEAGSPPADPLPSAPGEPRLRTSPRAGFARPDLPALAGPPSRWRVALAFFAVGVLAALDAVEHVPALSAYLPDGLHLFEVYDLAALAIIFLAARSFNRMSVIGLGAMYILLHAPGAIVSISYDLAELSRTLLVSVGLIAGLYLTQRWREAEALLAGLALRDSITGLANTRQFYADLERFLGEARRYSTTGAVLFLDLDKFKSINDVYGHRAGDEYLRQMGAWLRGCVRAADWVARIGGDEFGVILTHVDAQGAAAVAERIRATADLQEAHHEGRPLHSSVSIGMARIPFDGMTLDEVLGRADAAMYRAKARGGNRAEFYSD